MRDDITDAKIPVASIGLFLPFHIATSYESTTDSSEAGGIRDSSSKHIIIKIVPLICNPNSSVVTHNEVLSLRAGLSSLNWHPQQHQTVGYVFSLEMNVDGPNKKVQAQQVHTPVCSMSNLEVIFGSYFSQDYKGLEYLHRLVTEASKEAIEEDFDDNVPINQRGQEKIKLKKQRDIKVIDKAARNISMISILTMISQMVKREALMNFFADALYQKMESLSLTDDLLSALCSPSSCMMNNNYMRTLILLQRLTKVRVHIEHYSDTREYMAQTLGAMGCFDGNSHDLGTLDDNSTFESYTMRMNSNETLQCSMKREFYMEKKMFIIHELGVIPSIIEGKISCARSLYDIISNISDNVYFPQYMESIRDFNSRLTYDIYIDVRNQVSLPAAELSTLAAKLFQKEPMNACIGTQYIVGHQMLQMIMYYLYDVKQDQALFPLLKSKVLRHLQDDSSNDKDHNNILNHVYNLSKEYSMLPGNDPFGMLCEAFDVTSGSMQAQHWSTEYTSDTNETNQSYAFQGDVNEGMSNIIYLPHNNFLSSNYTWSESLFSSLCCDLTSHHDQSAWERKDTAYMTFLMRFCYSDILRKKVAMFFECSNKLDTFNDILFASVMNISYTAYLSTIWKWCEKQSNSMFAKLWNDYRFRRQLASSQLPDIKVGDLKFGVQLQIGMKTVMMLPLWLLDIAQDKEFQKKARELTDSFKMILSRSNKHNIFKSFIINWGFSVSEYERFHNADTQSYEHLNLMMNVLCAFQSCLSLLKTDDWKESMSTENPCVSDYAKSRCKGSDCSSFSSMNRSFYHFVRMIMLSEIPNEDGDENLFLKSNNGLEANPLRFLFDHFHAYVMPQVSELEEGKSLSLMMGRLAFTKRSLFDGDGGNENKGDDEKNERKQRGKKANHKTSERARLTVEDFIEEIKRYYKLGSEEGGDLPTVDGQEMVPLIDIKNAIMMCCSNSPNSDGSISIVTEKTTSSSRQMHNPAILSPFSHYESMTSTNKGRDISNVEVGSTCSHETMLHIESNDRRQKRTSAVMVDNIPKRPKGSRIKSRNGGSVQTEVINDSNKENINHSMKNTQQNSPVRCNNNNDFSDAFNIDLAAFGL